MCWLFLRPWSFWLEACFTVYCTIFAHFELFLSFTQASAGVLSVTVLYLALAAIKRSLRRACNAQHYFSSIEQVRNEAKVF